MSTSFPENMSIKLVLRLKIERFEISEREKKTFFFPILITLGDPPLSYRSCDDCYRSVAESPASSQHERSASNV